MAMCECEKKKTSFRDDNSVCAKLYFQNFLIKKSNLFVDRIFFLKSKNGPNETLLRNRF